jgi:hypothetical protein
VGQGEDACRAGRHMRHHARQTQGRSNGVWLRPAIETAWRLPPSTCLTGHGLEKRGQRGTRAYYLLWMIAAVVTAR